MKKLSIMIPCYNEEENVREICAAVIEVLQKDLPQYDYEILFIDNCNISICMMIKYFLFGIFITFIGSMII